MELRPQGNLNYCGALPPRRESSYTLVVLQHVNYTASEVKNGPYDVEIHIGDSKIEPIIRPMGRKIVLKKSIISSKNPNMTLFTRYMRWKFRYHQIKHKEVDALLFIDKMTHIDAPLKWIESIINVELDYHLGARECLRRENAKYLDAYVDDPWSGYGPDFYVEGPPISKSRMYSIFLKNE